MSNTSTSFTSVSATPVVTPNTSIGQHADDVGPRKKSENATEAESISFDPSQSAFVRDKALWCSGKPTPADYLLHAVKESQRNPFAVLWEFRKLNKQLGRITLSEYVHFGLYDAKMPFEHKQRFITGSLHWPITKKCCDMTWQAATEDKWLCSKILQGTSVVVPETLAVIDKTDRKYPGTNKISTASQLRKFLLANRGQLFFGKENRGMVSFGVFLVLEADSRRLHLKGEGWIEYEKFMDLYVGDTIYLLQRCQKNHKFFEKYTDNLATVRVCVLVTDDGIKIPFTVLKLPAPEQIADSFWRSGNLACNVDPKSGQILSARTRNRMGTECVATHPVTGAPLVNEYLPEWDSVMELVHHCSPIFAPVRYQSMDIAITDEGPMLIEINTGGGFDLIQLATGEGMLTDEVTQFFKSLDCPGF